MAQYWASCLMTLLLCTCWLTSAAPDEDRITSLPGLDDPISFKQYSGYLSASDTKKIFYWFVEAEEQPTVAPLVVWFNGGPGCSSLLGFFTQHGPFKVPEEEGQPLVMNPYSWNKLANVLYLESPAGVGYSYVTDDNYTTDDDQNAVDNHAALNDFFRLFPEFQSNELFLAGESYGTVYVATLAVQLLEDQQINFKGMAVVSAVTDWDLMDDTMMYFIYTHGLVGQSQWRDALGTCCQDHNQYQCPFQEAARQSDECKEQVDTIKQVVETPGLNTYNIYATCDTGVPKSDKQENKSARSAGCLDISHVAMYLDAPDVRAALHVVEDAGPWELCSSAVGDDYTVMSDTVMPQYNTVLEQGGLILLIYGDGDMGNNILSGERFVENMGVTQIQNFTEWYYVTEDGEGTREIAGFSRRFLGMEYVTVKGAGHMVGSDAPDRMYLLMENFLPRDNPDPGVGTRLHTSVFCIFATISSAAVSWILFQ